MEDSVNSKGIAKGNTPFLVAVVGGREVSADQLELARSVGELIARSGAILLCGGMGGIMEAVSQGAAHQGGLVVGILPGGKKEEANPFVSIPIATGIGIARNSILAHSADLLIALSGQYGTLSEIAYALQLGKKVLSFGSWTLAEKKPRGLVVIESLEQLEGILGKGD